MNRDKCELIPKHNSYRHLTKDNEYIDCHFKAHNYIHQLEKQNTELKEENERLKNNWNELKNFIVEEKSKIVTTVGIRTYIKKQEPYIEILDKMQELEENLRGGNNE